MFAKPCTRCPGSATGRLTVERDAVRCRGTHVLLPVTATVAGRAHERCFHGGHRHAQILNPCADPTDGPWSRRDTDAGRRPGRGNADRGRRDPCQRGCPRSGGRARTGHPGVGLPGRGDPGRPLLGHRRRLPGDVPDHRRGRHPGRCAALPRSESCHRRLPT